VVEKRLALNREKVVGETIPVGKRAMPSLPDFGYIFISGQQTPFASDLFMRQRGLLTWVFIHAIFIYAIL
jgi:hypothetical protein